MNVLELIGQAAFALETVAHLKGKESVLLPLADGLREVERRMQTGDEPVLGRDQLSCGPTPGG